MNETQMYILFENFGDIVKYNVKSFKCESIGMSELPQYMFKFTLPVPLVFLDNDIFKVQIMFGDFIISTMLVYDAGSATIIAYSALWIKEFRQFMDRLNRASKYYQDGGQITF